ncbi:hypothetical protein BGW36DRAFT_386928 [Talaromyces proteolyticus]|uniref:Oxidoreductase acuF-like C2H2 type zinc-finger domain-containing protein n=1 Tax=Talaromyces proteolyticus TaxID=1131652 RepID=A0AAD4KMU3_9EURO|nr:uncharacterized protein BGW36DRAFT_386928 [Talaromyces proteolyticus]KAH8692087.1 hypothetical protein BGW36DRAFT_386928 [Talaromyces proteolyticus]
MAIATGAAQCDRLFEKWMKAIADHETALMQGAENQVFRFNLWTANNFIYAPTRASMDWRLRNAPFLESVLIDLLDDLKSNLIKQSSFSKITMVSADEEFASFPDVISEILDGIFRFSRAVRRSGILRRFVKLASYVEYDENGVNLTEGFRKGAERIIDFRLKDSRASNSLKSRIVDSICLRQQHFSYLRARKAKNTPINNNTNKQSPAPKSTLSATFTVTGSVSPSKPNKRPRKSPRDPRMNLSLLTATTVEPDRMPKAYSIKSAENSEGDDVKYDDLDIPAPPKAPDHLNEFECPYCFLVCSVGELTGERWKRHIIEDLMPYVCVLEPCPTPNTLFESGKDWINHMKSQHIVNWWTCMDRDHSSTPYFDTEIGFKEHMYEHHAEQFEPAYLEDIAAACYQQLPEVNMIAECPFCSEEQSMDIPRWEMISHVAAHLLSLAQISLAGHIDGDGGESEGNESVKTLSNNDSHSGSTRSLAGSIYSDNVPETTEEEHRLQDNIQGDTSVPDIDPQQCSVLWDHIQKGVENPMLDPKLQPFIDRINARMKIEGVNVGISLSGDSLMSDFNLTGQGHDSASDQEKHIDSPNPGGSPQRVERSHPQGINDPFVFRETSLWNYFDPGEEIHPRSPSDRAHVKEWDNNPFLQDQ